MSGAVRLIRFDTDALSGTHAPILDVSATERLFSLTSCRVRVLLEHAPEGDVLLGADASVHLETDSAERSWHGIITSLGITPRPAGDFILRVDIQPKHALLSLGRNSRIFQHQTVQQIVDDVFERAGMPEDSCTWSLAEPLPSHRNVHQYNESDYTFVRRLLAEEGLNFAFENDETGSRIHIFDSVQALRSVPGVDALVYDAMGQGVRYGLHSLEEEHRVTTGSVCVQDFDLERPRDFERARASVSGGAGPQVYTHPIGFDPRDSLGLRNRRAQRTLEAVRRDRRTLLGHSGVVFLEAGRRILVQGHERIDLNEALILTEVKHHCVRSSNSSGAYDYDNEFRALPDDVEPRPDRERARARATGLQPAIVTAPTGQEHLSDDLGRVRVRFRWDRSESDDSHSSTWCRVAQPQLPSPQVIPRSGFEVDVDFEQGDWDRPTVVGHRYNAETLVPYPLPASSAQSAWQSATLTAGPLVNEMRFDDTQGAEEVYFHASMNTRAVVEHDAVRRVVHDESVNVGIRRALTVTQNLTAVVQRDRRVSTGRNTGVRVGRNYADAVGEEEHVTCARRRLQTGGDLTEQVQGDLTRTVGPLQVICGITSFAHRTLGDSTTSIGTALLEVTGGNRMLSVRGDLTEEVSALKLIEAGAFRATVTSGFDHTFTGLDIEVQTDRTDHAESEARLAADGDLTLNAEHISVTATDQLSISAGSSEIVLRASGEITLRAPRVNLRNADALGATVEVN